MSALVLLAIVVAEGNQQATSDVLLREHFEVSQGVGGHRVRRSDLARY